jgi:glycosyltransferase involved in cell wall biosynthesis
LLVTPRPRLLFVSPRFLFPADSGGKIRTTQILRNLRGGAFEVTLLSPSSAHLRAQHAADIAAVCDRFEWWEEDARGAWHALTRLRHVFSDLPIPVASDRSAHGARAVAAALAQRPDLAVFDFPHSAVLAPATIGTPSALFTHNVEAEIFRRHLEVAANPITRALWEQQHARMVGFERQTLQRFDRVIAVSDRDARVFAETYGVSSVRVIPTGVDLDYFAYAAPQPKQRVVFTGSMDWLANIDGIDWFMDEVWPRVLAREPEASMTVIGRTPPERLVSKARARGFAWSFTGFVDDVRPRAQGASVFVIPLRVGGGTRIKAFEAMAMGIPVVSTAIGVEGLAIEDGRHYLRADDADGFAAAVVRLLAEPALGLELSVAARHHVEAKFSNRAAGRAFEVICLEAMKAA